MKAVGRSLHRIEGIPKVTGKSVYVADMPIEGCLYGRTIRSTVAHGLIRNIRFNPGIPWNEFVIVRPEDIPGKNGVTLIDTEQPFLASREIRHIGEPLLLIAHEDRAFLDRAAHNIEIEVDELPGMFSMEHALQSGRVFKSYRVQNGDPSEALKGADVIVEETYLTGSQEHLYIEPQGMIAVASPGEGLTVWGSMQCPYYIRKALAPLFEMPPDKIRVVQMETGGGFGGKEEYPNMIAGHAALLSWKAGGRPVKLIYDRREDMLATTKRHPSRTHIKAGFTRDGKLIGLDIDILLDGGAYPTLSSVVLSRATLHAWGPYRCEHTRVQGNVVMTNSNPYGAFRGFGAPQAIFAIELHMTRAADILGLDPTEIRRRNFLRRGDRMPTGQVIKENIDLEQLMDRALERAGYDKKRQHPQQGRGLGVSVFFHGSGFTGSGEVRLASRVSLRLRKDNHVDVLVSNVEYGQGTNTILAQIVAETCQIPPEHVEVHRPDTLDVPDSGPTVASRTTMIVGKLIERAALQLRDRLNESRSQDVIVTVEYQPPDDVYWNDETYQGEAYAAYSWSCNVAEVQVDPVDYAARLTNFTSTVECGRVINPALAEGQIQGGIAQGIGFALYEHVVVENGAMKNNQYTNYIVPTAADTPNIDVEFIEFPYANPGPFFAKGIGEMPIDGPAPAIAAAVADALGGTAINEVPLLPERIMAAVLGKDQS
jgi:CO/xanthine dehydrogenase Mo-binding subunit